RSPRRAARCRSGSRRAAAPPARRRGRSSCAIPYNVRNYFYLAFRIITDVVRNSGPRVVALGGADALVVAVRDAPLIGAPRRPLPVLRAADLVVLADLFDLGGVLDDAAVRPDEVAEDVVAGPMTSWSPDRREAGVAHAADAAHHAIDARHLEGDVISEETPGARIGDAMMRAIATHEIHV